MMNNTQILRDFTGKIIGFIETDTKGNKTVRDFYRRIKGYYDADLDVTRDFYKRIVARGDVSSSLLDLK